MFIYNIALNNIMKITPYLAGVLFGDGTINKGKNRAYAVWIDQHKRNSKVIKRVVSEFKNIGLKVYDYEFLNKERALVYSKEIFLEFSYIRKNIGKYFKSLSTRNKWEFISGIFDAEGTVTDRIVIYNNNTQILKEIKNFLEEQKIVCYIYKFGKTFGLQIYQRNSVGIFKMRVNSVRIHSF